MTTPLTSSTTAVSAPGAPTGANPLPSVTSIPAGALPVLSPGHQSSEFYLALVIVAAIVSALWAGKLDPAPASALLGLIVSGYPALRTWLKAQHVDAMADVLAAQGGPAGLATRTLAAVLHAGPDSTSSPADLAQSAPRETSGATSSANLGVLSVLGAMLLGLSGCAQTPYYVSGITGTVDTSKDGSSIHGGGIGVTISPNPYYPSTRSLPKMKGYAK